MADKSNSRKTPDDAGRPDDKALNAAQSQAAGAESADGDAAGSISLMDQLEAARAERDVNYDLYLRSQAELQNYRKRAQKEADDKTKQPHLDGDGDPA